MEGRDKCGGRGRGKRAVIERTADPGRTSAARSPESVQPPKWRTQFRKMKPFILRRLGKHRQTHLSGCKPARGLTVANAFIIQPKGEVISAGVDNQEGCRVEGGSEGRVVCKEGRGLTPKLTCCWRTSANLYVFISRARE